MWFWEHQAYDKLNTVKVKSPEENVSGRELQ